MIKVNDFKLGAGWKNRDKLGEQKENNKMGHQAKLYLQLPIAYLRLGVRQGKKQ